MAGETVTDPDASTQEPSEGSRLRQALEAEKERNDKNEREIAAMRLERAFEKAGIPESGPGVGLFRAHYTGEQTVEAIRAAAEAEGILAPVQATPDAERQQLDALHSDHRESLTRPEDMRVDSKHIEAIQGFKDNDELMAYLRKNSIVPATDD